MRKSNSFDKDLLKIRSDHARLLKNDILTLKNKVRMGRYDDDDLSILANLLKNIRQNFVGNDTRLSEKIGVSSKTIALTYSGQSRPKYTTFIKLLHGAEDICEEEIRFPGSQDVDSKIDGEFVFPTNWHAQWINIDKNQDLITNIIGALERLIIFTNRSNSVINSEKILITDLQRTQLIAILETSLAMLKSPMVEVGFLKKLGGWLSKIGKKSAEKQIQDAFGSAAREGADILSEFINSV